MPYLIYAPDTANERVYELKPGVNTLGRLIDNSIVLLEETVSRYHAEIYVSSNGVTIKDCRSRNHTFVDGVKIDFCTLDDGNEVSCGQVQFKYVYCLAQPKLKLVRDDEGLSSNNLKQIPLPQSRAPIQELVSKEPSEKSVLKLPARDREQQAVNKLKILLEVSQQLCSPDEPDILLKKILDLIFQLMGIDRATILLVNDDSRQLEPKATKLREGIDWETDFWSHKIVNLAYQTGDAIITQDARRDERFKGSVSILREAIQNCMCVPLKTYTEVIGVLYVDNLSPFVTYSDEDLEFLSALANQAAVAIHMSREFHRREQILKQQVLELQIQIDQVKKESEVAEIMSLDYFQNLQKRAEKLRNKNTPP